MHTTVDPLSAAALTLDSQNVIATAPLGGLVLAEAPSHVAAAEAAAAVLVRDHPKHDVLLATARGTRWTVDEAQTYVLDPARYAPDEHRHIVLADSHKASAGVHDRFLKHLEEAPAGTTFWFTYPAGETLPPALRGRASEHAILHAAARPVVASALVNAHEDLTLEHAAELLRLCDDDPALAAAVHRFDLRAAAATYSRHPRTSAPTTTGQELTLALAHLAVAKHHKVKKAPVPPTSKKGTVALADLTRLSPEARASLRRLVDTLLSRWERTLVAELAAADTAQARELSRQLRDLAQVREQAVFNTPVPTLLSLACTAAHKQ